MALSRRFQSSMLLYRRLFSSSGNNTTFIGSKEQSRAALSLIRFEQNPECILDICRSAALTPESHLDHIVFSKAISKLKEVNHHDGIHAFIEDSINHPSCRSECYIAHCIIMYGQGGLINDALKLFQFEYFVKEED